jgi:YidC/Oxa1 family membrane protein insertase
MQQKNLPLAIVLSALILFGWVSLSRYLWPPPPPQQENTEVAKNDERKKPKNDENKKPAAKEKDKNAAEKKPDEQKKVNAAERVAAADLQQLPETPPGKLVELGSREGDSRFHLYVVIDPRGAAVQSVWLNKYQAADIYGRPVWRDADKKQPMLLALVPPGRNAHAPSFQMFAFDVHAPNDDQPLDTLARLNWTVLDKKSEDVNGRRRESVSFQAETQGVIVTKTYTLTEGEYHLGLTVAMQRKKGADKTITFRYQMTGAHGLPVEGKWYTSTFRNALIALVDKNGGVTRDLQELRQISSWGGGNEVRRDPGNALIYAFVANQFFASGIAVDNDQKIRGFLRQARPTLETTLTKGTVVSTAEDGSSFILKPVGNEPERTFYMPKETIPADVHEGKHLAMEASRNNLNAYVTLLLQNQPLTAVGCSSYFVTAPIPQNAVRLDNPVHGRFHKGQRVAILHHTGSAPDRNGEYPEIATASYPEDALPAVWVDDITVRVSTEAVELKDDVPVVHKYLLYNGPVKVSQLFPPPGLPDKPFEQGGVQRDLFARYHDELHLNTLTDYHSPGAMGQFSNAIYWTALVIKCTNIMHAVLGYIHAVIPSYGLCIIVLTVLVRGMMFPLSRKQALMSVRMQQLQPELKKLQEKYKDDRQTLGMAQMELYRKHGVNPFGSCWVLLLQMPIFMGLYFALQESTHFRLASFWPTWIDNLAAPDMLFRWGERIWWISRVEDYGSFLYLGPYFNLLPVIAVILMIAQQKMMTPPPADEQQAMQQKMMKYMMIFFGLMFYKVAAGLCLYFIASSAWGFCERKLLPKKKTDLGEPVAPAGESYFHKLLRRAQGEHGTPAPATAVTTRNGGIIGSSEMRGRSSGKRGRNKRRQGAASGDETATQDASMLGRWRKRLHDWWIAVLKEAEKKNRS